MEAACRVYWDNLVVHYGVFAILGPLLGFMAVWLLVPHRPRVALALFCVLNLASLWLGLKASPVCQQVLFHEVGDDPGDVGLAFFTLPLFAFAFLGSTAASLFVARLRRGPASWRPSRRTG